MGDNHDLDGPIDDLYVLCDKYRDSLAYSDDERAAVVQLRAACDRYLAAASHDDEPLAYLDLDAGPDLAKLRADFIDQLARYFSVDFDDDADLYNTAASLVAALHRNVEQADT